MSAFWKAQMSRTKKIFWFLVDLSGSEVWRIFHDLKFNEEACSRAWSEPNFTRDKKKN